MAAGRTPETVRGTQHGPLAVVESAFGGITHTWYEIVGKPATVYGEREWAENSVARELELQAWIRENR